MKKTQEQIDATANNILKACNAFVSAYNPRRFADKWTRFDKKQVTQLYNLPDVISYNTFGFSKLTARYLCTNN